MEEEDSRILGSNKAEEETEEIQQIRKEINHYYKEIFNFSQISQNYNYNDCIDWLNDKDYRLFSLEKRLKKVIFLDEK